MGKKRGPRGATSSRASKRLKEAGGAPAKAAQGGPSPWQEPTHPVLETVFQKLLAMESGKRWLRHASHTCAFWRSAAQEVLLEDTAISRPPPEDLALGPPRAAGKALALKPADTVTTQAAVVIEASASTGVEAMSKQRLDAPPAAQGGRMRALPRPRPPAPQQQAGAAAGAAAAARAHRQAMLQLHALRQFAPALERPGWGPGGAAARGARLQEGSTQSGMAAGAPAQTADSGSESDGSTLAQPLRRRRRQRSGGGERLQPATAALEAARRATRAAPPAAAAAAAAGGVAGPSSRFAAAALDAGRRASRLAPAAAAAVAAAAQGEAAGPSSRPAAATAAGPPSRGGARNSAPPAPAAAAAAPRAKQQQPRGLRGSRQGLRSSGPASLEAGEVTGPAAAIGAKRSEPAVTVASGRQGARQHAARPQQAQQAQHDSAHTAVAGTEGMEAAQQQQRPARRQGPVHRPQQQQQQQQQRSQQAGGAGSGPASHVAQLVHAATPVAAGAGGDSSGESDVDSSGESDVDSSGESDVEMPARAAARGAVAAGTSGDSHHHQQQQGQLQQRPGSAGGSGLGNMLRIFKPSYWNWGGGAGAVGGGGGNSTGRS